MRKIDGHGDADDLDRLPSLIERGARKKPWNRSGYPIAELSEEFLVRLRYGW